MDESDIILNDNDTIIDICVPFKLFQLYYKKGEILLLCSIKKPNYVIHFYLPDYHNFNSFFDNDFKLEKGYSVNIRFWKFTDAIAPIESAYRREWNWHPTQFSLPLLNFTYDPKKDIIFTVDPNGLLHIPEEGSIVLENKPPLTLWETIKKSLFKPYKIATLEENRNG